MSAASLQVRVLLLVLLPGAAIALLLSGYFLYVRFDDLEHAYLDRGRALARQLAPAAQYGLFAGDRDELARLCAAVMKEPDVVAVTIRDARDVLLATAGAPTSGALTTQGLRNAAEVALHTAQRRLFAMPVVGAALPLETYFELRPAEQRLGAVTVEMSLSELEEWKRRQVIYSIGVALAILLLSTLAAIRLGRGLTHPIRQLSRTVSALARGDFSRRAEEASTGELLTLERGVNHMAAALRVSHDDLQRRIADATAELAARKEQAEQSSASKTRFLAAASHDLRQPMQALGLWVSALRLQAREPELARTCEKIEASVDVLGEMLNALLDISRLDAGNIRPEPRTVSLDALFDRLGPQFEPQARAKGLRLVTRRCGLAVHSDPVLLTRILHNLVSNAIKYTASGRVLLCARRRGDGVRIEVRDSGPGIAADRQALVFEEFYQIDNPERDRDKGLGMGLAIVQRLTRLLDIPCQLRSAPGAGSTFAVTVPQVRLARPEATPAMRTPDLDAARLRGRRVDLLDDDPLIRSSVADLLRALGCEVRLAATPAELDGHLQSSPRPPDLLICDYRLAGPENGVAVINRTRARVGAQLPCLLISGDLDPDLSRLARTTRIRLLSKPVQARMLTQVMIELLAP